MISQKKEYYFCFCLTKLQLLEDIQNHLELFTHFRIDILKSNRPIITSEEMLCATNEHAELILNEMLFFRLGEEREGCELRLIMILEEGEEKVIGRYQFQLANYIRAYQELRRNCIEMSVQIAPHYVLLYDVFLQRTEEALQRIIREHQTAVRFNMHGDVLSEIDSFLPHQITNENLEEVYRDIKIDGASPLLFHQRFWSPKRSRFSSNQKLSILSKNSEGKALETTNNSLIPEGNRVSLVNLKKSISSASELDQSKIRKCSNSATNIIELDIESQPQTEDQHKRFFQLYQVIKSDSKIVLPEDLDQNREVVRNNVPLNGPAAQKQKVKRSIKKYHNHIKYIGLAIILITIIGFFVFLFDKPSLQIQKISKPKRGKKKA